MRIGGVFSGNGPKNGASGWCVGWLWGGCGRRLDSLQAWGSRSSTNRRVGGGGVSPSLLFAERFNYTIYTVIKFMAQINKNLRIKPFQYEN